MKKCDWRALRLGFLVLVGLALTAEGQEILKERGTDWDYLFYREGNSAVDPETVDADFDTTWFLPATQMAYDGPAFTTGTAPLGYGGFDNDTLATNIWNPDNTAGLGDAPPLDIDAMPPVTRLHTAYFRTQVTPTGEVATLEFAGLIDDGLVIYVNGVRVGDFSVESGDDDYRLPAINVSANERTTLRARVENLSLPANQPIDIAISLHNDGANGGTSSDLGIDLSIAAVLRPANDNFADAITLDRSLRGSTGSKRVMGDTSSGLGATREMGEPNHAGVTTGSASVWYLYDANQSQRLFLSLDTSRFDTSLAVYQGTEISNLTPVSRYQNLVVPASSTRDGEAFARGAYVEFDVAAGQQYYIAIDGANGSSGEYTLTYGDALVQGLNPLTELVAAGSTWDYLLYTDAANMPADPASVDADFHQTWQTAAGYDGPAFMSGEAPLGYGDLETRRTGGFGDPEDRNGPVTDIWGMRGGEDLPPSGERYSAYFRTTFTPTEAIDALAVYGTIDDGAVVWVNGRSAQMINIMDDPMIDNAIERANWQLLADATTLRGIAVERIPQGVIISSLDLPANQPVEIAVSVHNQSPTSSDLALDLQVFRQQTDPNVGNPPALGARPVLMAAPGRDGFYNLDWEWDEGVTFQVLAGSDLANLQVQNVTVTGGGGAYFAEVPLPAGTETYFFRVVEVTP